MSHVGEEALARLDRVRRHPERGLRFEGRLLRGLQCAAVLLCLEVDDEADRRVHDTRDGRRPVAPGAIVLRQREEDVPDRGEDPRRDDRAPTVVETADPRWPHQQGHEERRLT